MRVRPSSSSGGVAEGTDSRHSGSSPAKNGSACSRIPFQKRAARSGSTAAPPSFSSAARTAAAAPESRTPRSPSVYAVALIGSGLPAHLLTASSALSSGISNFSVASATGTGSTLSDTSRMTPSVPSAPAIRRETS